MLEVLEIMGSKLGNKAARRACRAGAADQRVVAFNTSPALSGKTKAALKVRSIKRSSVKVGGRVTLSSKSFAFFYPAMVTLGTHRIKKTARWWRIAFTQAIAQTKQTVMKTLGDEINRWRGQDINDNDTE